VKPTRSLAAIAGLTFLLCAVIPLPASGQLVSLPAVERPPEDLPLDFNLWKHERFAAERRLTGDDLKRELRKRGTTVEGDDLVHVEIVGPVGREALGREFVESFGGIADTSWRHRLDAWIPIDRLSDLARAVPEGYFVERASPGCPDDVMGEGPEVINSDSYKAAGYYGSGVTVGVIDSGFIGASAAEANGDLAGYGYVNYAWGGLEDYSTHGTGCAEALYDHAPGAVMWLYRTDSVSDLGSAVEHAMDNGIDILTHSQSRYNQGWGDDSGDACAAANYAAQHGILFFTSAGNRAQQHWQGTFYAGAGDPLIHDWAYGDETIDIQVEDGCEMHAYVQWAGDGVLDIFVGDDKLDIIDYSAGYRFQEVVYTNDTGSTQLVHLIVVKTAGTPGEFEVFTHDFLAGCDWQEHWIEQGSTTSPSNSTDGRVISVGAVPWWDFQSPPGTTSIIAEYSSQGPSNGGMAVPDVAGPTNTTGFTYPGGFGGTSCATPNVAGAAAAFLSADLQLNAYPIWWLMAVQSQHWRDWGSSGIDMVYGNGGAYLLDCIPGSLWLARDYGNTTDSRHAPFYTMQAAHDWATSGSTIRVLPGGNYPEPATLDKELQIETLVNPTVLGE
jgi:subtilisin family serine protease